MKLASKREYLNYYKNFVLCLPHIIVFLFHRKRSVIQADIIRNLEEIVVECRSISGLIYLFTFMPSFRNVFYYRIQPLDFILKIFCWPLSTLVIRTDFIGAGFVVPNGFATAIGAKSIGNNCSISQQVTIGASNYGSPTIMNDVTIYAGAIVFGNITIGNNVVIGANATVFTDVPDNSTVLPGTSKIMKWKKKTP